MSAHPRVTVTHRSGLAHSVRAGSHEFVTDEPADAGGDDQGPTPWEYLLAAAGSCTSITVQMYAQRKGWELTCTEVALTYDSDAGVIDMQVQIDGKLDDAQRERIAAVAGKCPIVRALQQGIEVRKRIEVPT